jgi:hypothetical protein
VGEYAVPVCTFIEEGLQSVYSAWSLPDLLFFREELIGVESLVLA